MTHRFRPLTSDTAPPAARALTAASEKRFGFLPSPVARAARSPALLQHMFAGFAAFERSTLTALEREVVAMTVAFDNACSYCVAMHSALLAEEPGHAALVRALREGGTLDDARLEALRVFTRAVLRDRGRVPEHVWAAFEAAGYGEEQALDVVLGVSVYVLSTLANVMTRAEIEPVYEPFRWRRPDARAAE